MSTTVSYFDRQIKFVIDWTVPSFSTLKAQTEPMYSATTTVGTSTWCLALYHRDLDGAEVDLIKTTGLYLEHTFNGTDHYEIRTQFKIGDYGLFNANNEVWGCPAVFEHNDIWGPKAGLILKNDKLKLRAEIEYLPPKDPPLDKVLPEGAAEPLKKKLKVLSDCNVGKDFVLVAADGTERLVHRSVLKANSPVFQAMFEADMMESKEGRCEMPDITTQTLDLLINFMYFDNSQADLRGKCPRSSGGCRQLDELKEACQRILVNETTDETAAHLLILADRVGALTLKEAAIGHVVTNIGAMQESGQVKNICVEGGSDLAQALIGAVARLAKE
ncbi:LOW QUALITY PROTEIN: hypothetical protein RvY_18333 [Ramazzottius varieornatus]|uniref:BTB domain-containing protein n=1 Tax=Ramazzottius varieornatus TaxID=947166 RepID=A0A1D1WAA8_RAMVA|nr:LOW QUALITY PROTEIN: hypothetical protein RvY_18333 [Ramazzottius varieornatus]